MSKRKKSPKPVEIRPAWFCWEWPQASKGKPHTAVYFDDHPGAGEKGTLNEHRIAHRVPDDCRDGDEVFFGKLAERFPAPIQEI